MSPPDPVTAAGRDAMSAHFGSRLKYWRRNRGFTQAELARALAVDGSYISKLESSRRHPNPDIARRCDELLNTGGELDSLLSLMEGDRGFDSAAVVPMPVLWTAPPPHHPPSGPDMYQRPAASAHTMVTLSRLLEAYTDIDCSMGGHQIGAAVEQQAQDIIGMHIGTVEPMTSALLVLAAKFARLAGWIRFDARDHTGSRFWHDCGQRWALAGGEPALAAELLARQSIVHSSFGDPMGGVALAVASGELSPDMPVAGRVWALLAQARGQAMAGQPEPALSCLTHAEKLLSGGRRALMASPSHHTNDFLWHVMAGKARLDLALAGVTPRVHATEAVILLRKAVADLPSHHVRDLALTRIRLSRALALTSDMAAARGELAEAESLARRCSSGRLHAALPPARTQLAADQSGG
jgi:DNA-binding XRE family transcriptional regulator